MIAATVAFLASRFVSNPLAALLTIALLAMSGVACVQHAGKVHAGQALVAANASLQAKAQALATADAQIDAQNASIEALKAAGQAQAARLRAAQARAAALAKVSALPALPQGCEPAAKAANTSSYRKEVLENW
ncbi:hypothetical protein [Burkholderia cepacia]|uniref:hypothetical protein n=1 Tax=Burkholderia cepacia TaxID=292 RepID=UPI00075B528C|nr:hypothetical protein [Burkholderia cepacia]KWF99074.1 hypothetical protein WL95_00220 [Burkholderia cepacia]